MKTRTYVVILMLLLLPLSTGKTLILESHDLGGSGSGGCSHVTEIHAFTGEVYLLNVSSYPGGEYRVEIC